MRRITIMLLFMFVASHASATERVMKFPTGMPTEVTTSTDLAGYVALDQTTPQVFVNGIPLLTGLTPSNDYDIATKKYVDDNAGVSNLDGGFSNSVYASVTASPIDGGDAT